MRPGSLAVVAVVCAILGASTALVVAKAAGWVDPEEATRTVLLTTGSGTPADNPIDEDAEAKPLQGNDFDPAALYRERAAGVVTLLAVFGPDDSLSATDMAQGSGFVVSSDGYILTNSHVITTAGEGDPTATPEAASTVYVEFRDGDRVRARIVGWDVYDDVGLLKVRPADHHLTVVPLGDSGHVVVGQPVAAIGSPFGNASSLSVGVVSATERSIASLTSSYDLVDAIQTDAPINRGNSGGPLFDARGRVIGINAQINSNSGNAEGVGFAVPINSARRSMEQLIKSGDVRYAWLGVSTQTLTPRLAEHFGYPVDAGAAVQTVVAGSPASKAGIQGGDEEQDFTGIPFRPGGDVIVAIDGVPVQTAEDVVRAVTEGLHPGESTRLSLLRGSKRIEVTVELGERPATPPGSDR
ncbi:MAG TPA: trypsin-like peptidase domain-containing protein [Gaiellaceae bacterium]|nr:trypsin-like peptidase domain-containing protein [Gaiellaceae bacterium]